MERAPPPLTLHVTPLLPESFVTVAVRVVVSLGSTVVAAADTVTLLGGLAHPERPTRARNVTATSQVDALVLRVGRI